MGGGVVVEGMGLGIAGGRLASRPYQNLRNLAISPTAPITLTLILSQDGRGDKKGGYDRYAKVSRMGEEVRGEHPHLNLPPSRGRR